MIECIIYYVREVCQQKLEQQQQRERRKNGRTKIGVMHHRAGLENARASCVFTLKGHVESNDNNNNNKNKQQMTLILSLLWNVCHTKIGKYPKECSKREREKKKI